MKYLLDTSVISQLEKLSPDPAVARWWQQQSATDLMLSVIVIQELRFGIERLPAGKRRQSLEIWLAQRLRQTFQGRILAVDEVIADLGGRLLAVAKNSGHTAEVGDVLIAATALTHGLSLATLNRKHFERLGVEMVQF